MFAERLLQNFLKKSLNHKHKLHSLVESTLSFMRFNRLTLSEIARGIDNKNKVKSNINKVNRLIGSRHLNHEIKTIYKSICHDLLKQIKRPVIAVDWSSTPATSDSVLLCATVCICRRGFVCFEKTYPKNLYNSQSAHKDFINCLSSVLPENCRPIIVTDAASSFGVIWFRIISAKKWSWVGRVRSGHKHFKIEGKWTSINDLYLKSSKNVTHTSNVYFTKKHQFCCNLTTVKKSIKPQKSKSYNTKRSHRHTTAKHKRQGGEPWVLVSSPDLSVTKKTLISIYATRMSIEERFRDTKDPNFGSGFLLSRSRSATRIENLLLIDVIAKYILWIIGIMAERKGIAKEFQSNTITHRRVLSIIRLGREVFRHKRFQEHIHEIKHAKCLLALGVFCVK